MPTYEVTTHMSFEPETITAQHISINYNRPNSSVTFSDEYGNLFLFLDNVVRIKKIDPVTPTV